MTHKKKRERRKQEHLLLLIGIPQSPPPSPHSIMLTQLRPLGSSAAVSNFVLDTSNKIATLRSQGLRPKTSQVVLDTLSSAVLFYISNRYPIRPLPQELAALFLLLVGTRTLWDRWPIAFPSIPVLFFQLLRLYLFSGAEKRRYHVLNLLRIGSNLFAALSVILCILFPPLQLKPPTGPYAIGAVDVFLPRYPKKQEESTTSNSDFIAARIFYPASSTAQANTPYFYRKPSYSNQFLNALVKNVMPIFPLNRCGWILRTWKLVHVPAEWGAQVMHPPSNPTANTNQPWPVVIHSHGLFGSPHIYTHQALTLASHGSVVVMLHHPDGSSPMVVQQDGSTVEYSAPIITTSKSKNDDQNKTVQQEKYIELVRARRLQTHERAVEMIAAFESLKILHEESILVGGVSFQGKLNVSNVVFLGHSFGGATALTAAAYRPDITLAVVAHEPATDWMPDYVRRVLLMNDTRRKGSSLPYTGGTGGFTTHADIKQNDHTTIHSTHAELLHNDVHMLVLFSDQWAKLGWGGFPILKCMHDRAQFGPDGKSRVEVVHQMKHQEFSDTCALTPLWLGRITGATGERNPLDTLDDVMHRTLDFLSTVRTNKKSR